MAGLDLAPGGEARRADHMRARLLALEPIGPVGPGCSVQTEADRLGHQLVIGGVVIDRVDAVPEAIVRAQHRWIGVGLLAPADDLGVAGTRSEPAQLLEPPGASFALGALAEGEVEGEHVVPL